MLYLKQLNLFGVPYPNYTRVRPYSSCVVFVKLKMEMTFIPKHMKIHKLCIRSHTKKEKNIPRLALQFSSFGESEVRWKHIISGKLHYPQITSMYMRATFYFSNWRRKSLSATFKTPCRTITKNKN